MWKPEFGRVEHMRCDPLGRHRDYAGHGSSQGPKVVRGHACQALAHNECFITIHKPSIASLFRLSHRRILEAPRGDTRGGWKLHLLKFWHGYTPGVVFRFNLRTPASNVDACALVGI